jgi:hypothetical protein
VHQKDLTENGEMPNLQGSVCQEIICQQYWYKGELVEPANVVYLKFSEKWHRLSIDCGVIIWRKHEGPPTTIPMQKGLYSYLLEDLAGKYGCKGQTLLSLDSRSFKGGAEVSFVFLDRRKMTFRNVKDCTSCYFSDASPENSEQL